LRKSFSKTVNYNILQVFNNGRALRLSTAHRKIILQIKPGLQSDKQFLELHNMLYKYVLVEICTK